MINACCEIKLVPCKARSEFGAKLCKVTIKI